MLHTVVEMPTTKNTLSKKRAPIATVTKTVAKPLSKAKVTAVPKPSKESKGSARTLYKFTGKKPECKTPQMIALINTVMNAKKDELSSISFTSQDLVALAVKNGTLTTGQNPLRIFTFYAARLKEEGYFAKV
tara:strand:+ start:2055 stop:2450 length:396 start_codon:yes stop_codon:yes gene_type:complete